jgi:hypothetical protein
MGNAVNTSVVGQVVRALPGPLLRLLDAWSYRIARGRARARQEALARRQAGKTATPLPYL